MNNSTIDYCSICSKVIRIDYKDVGRRHGIVITFGYSRGGWGSRKNHIDFSGEICNECYIEYEEIVSINKKWFESKKDKNKPEISINYMSDMQKDKPPSKGYKGKILRLLS